MPGLFGVPLWGASPAVNAPLPGCDAANCIADLWFRLGFLSPDDMAIDDRWVTIAELYQFADDVVKGLASRLGLFMVYDASIAIVNGTGLYTMPAGHIFTVMAWSVISGTLQILRLTTSGQLFALDATWPATSGTPTRISFDAGGVGTGTLYPAPTANGTLAQILQQFPAAVVAGSSSIPVSPVLQGYFSYALLAAARSKESDQAMPEIAAHAKARMANYEKVFEHLYGAGR
jgi:hypothetical protein